jgi:GR25 family glycosyltransferase involved in LPS biosynthesis
MTRAKASKILIQVINLARRSDRLEMMRVQLERAGLVFETQVAVNGEKDGFKSSFLSKGEIGCWKSHVNSMRKMAEEGYQYSLILEDDATLSFKVDGTFLSEMMDLMRRNRIDLLQIGYIEHFYAPSIRSGVLEFLIAFLNNRGTKDTSGLRFVLGEFRAGAHAYIVNARLAEAISETVPVPPLIPWDGYLESLARGQIGRGDIRIARLGKSLVSQASRSAKNQQVDSDIST